ncbi:hypothetical protein [Sorangium sp. So ce124]|uniref:hypothetical protein n=1 Tax=Sorangium sp. So ce124 TaxID=3133280 RepID=UPI003F604965
MIFPSSCSLSPGRWEHRLAARVLTEDRAGRAGYRHALVREAIARSVPEAVTPTPTLAEVATGPPGRRRSGDRRFCLDVPYRELEEGRGVTSRA